MHGMTVIPLHNRDHIADSGSDDCRSGICSESHLSHMLHAGSSPGDGDTGENMIDIKISLLYLLSFIIKFMRNFTRKCKIL